MISTVKYNKIMEEIEKLKKGGTGVSSEELTEIKKKLTAAEN